MNARYRQDELIGKGGAGAVYKGFDTQLQRPVAIKRLLLHASETGSDSGTQGSPESLLQEAKTLSTFQHPNIVTVHDLGVDDEDHPFVVMEFINGETLDSLVERGPMTEKDFRILAADTLDALIAAHSQDLLHRDLKPSNLMLEWRTQGKFQGKLLDFGLAKLSHAPARQTIDQGGAVMGSIYFMAPEQFERSPLDARTDLYSLGATFYYALTGRNPFDGTTAPEVMAAHLQHSMVPLSELRPDLSPLLCQWVESLMKRRPEERFQTAQEALEAFQFEPTVVLKSAPVQKSGVSRAVVGVGLLSFLLLGGGAVWWLRSPSMTGEGLAEVPTDSSAAIAHSIVAKPELIAEPETVSPFDLDALGTMIGEPVTIEGTIVGAGESKSGKTRYLNFSNRPGTSLSIGFRVSEVDPLYSLTRLETMIGQEVQVTGDVIRLFGNLLVFVSEESQLTVLPTNPD